MVFLHGGGQTRSSWGAALDRVAEGGFYGISLDLRGHGDSSWAPDGDYGLDRHAEDLDAVLRTLGKPAFLVGASLGGMTSLLAAALFPERVQGLVLVDVAPRIELTGAQKINAFMRGNPDGFASVDEAAEAVARYLPHRPRPKDNSGLMKNLRLRESGRYHWHWDPRFLHTDRSFDFTAVQQRLEAAARSLRIPTLLVRGGLSEVVTPEGAREFLNLVPHAAFVDVEGADHMVAGDRNDAFNAAILSFLRRHRAD